MWKSLKLRRYLAILVLSLVCAVSAWAAIVFVGVQNNFISGTGTTIAVSYAATSGNFLVAWVRHGTNTTATISVSDDLAQTWTQAGSDCLVGTDKEAMWYRANTGVTATITATFGSAVSNSSLVVEEFSGIVTASPLDVASSCASNSSSVTTLTSSAITTTNANDVLIYGVHLGAGQSGAAWTPGSGFTLPSNNDATGTSSTNTRSALQYQIVSSIQTSFTTSITWTTASNAVGILAAFKSAGGAPPACVNSISLLGVGCQ